MAAGALLIIGVVAKTCLYGSNKLPGASEVVTSATPAAVRQSTLNAKDPNKITLLVCGLSKRGKSLWISQLINGLRTCINPALFRGTVEPKKYEIAIGGKSVTIIDTPGLSERSNYDQRSNTELLGKISTLIANEHIDAVIYTRANGTNLAGDLETIFEYEKIIPEDAKRLFLITQCENLLSESIEDEAKDYLSCMLNETRFADKSDLKKRFENSPVLLTGVLNRDEDMPGKQYLRNGKVIETNGDKNVQIRKVTMICRLMRDGVQKFAATLFSDQAEAQQFYEKIVSKFPSTPAEIEAFVDKVRSGTIEFDLKQDDNEGVQAAKAVSQ
ncbi:MAG: 50S ribosome-binding GTPase [Verrucomicrobia bacterium]|nr:50S ribosome-binding GTPase [Verrucomicrobiota bacterium]